MTDSIIFIEIDDSDYTADGPTGEWFLEEMSGSRLPLAAKIIIPDRPAYRKYYRLPAGSPIVEKFVAGRIFLGIPSGADHPAVNMIEIMAVPAPDWLVELAAKPVEIIDNPKHLTIYLRRFLSNDGQEGNQDEYLPGVPPCRAFGRAIRRRGFICFNPKDFGYSLGIRETKKLSELYDRLSTFLGVRFQQSIKYKGKVLKLAKVETRKLEHETKVETQS